MKELGNSLETVDVGNISVRTVKAFQADLQTHMECYSEEHTYMMGGVVSSRRLLDV